MMKKILSLCLVLVLTLIVAAPASAAMPDVMQPYYINTSEASIGLSISDTGMATVDMLCTGYSNVTRIEATLYIERKVGSQWVRVDNGTMSDTWNCVSNSRFFFETIRYQMPAKGEYKATVTFAVYATRTEVLTFSTTRTYA